MPNILSQTDLYKTTRIFKWKALFALESSAPLVECITNSTGWAKTHLPFKVKDLYQALSSEQRFKMSNLNGLELNTAVVTKEQLRVLVCLCQHFNVKYTVVIAEKPSKWRMT